MDVEIHTGHEGHLPKAQGIRGSDGYDTLNQTGFMMTSESYVIFITRTMHLDTDFRYHIDRKIEEVSENFKDEVILSCNSRNRGYELGR